MKAAVTRYRIMAIIAGLVLIAFTIEIFIKYVFGPEIPWFAQLHGAVCPSSSLEITNHVRDVSSWNNPAGFFLCRAMGC
jgi:hypothetical protein